MVGNIFAALPETLSSLLSMAIRGLNILADNADSILQMGLDLVIGLGSAIITALPYLAESALSIVTSLGEAILSTDWIQLGTDTINSLRESLDIAAGEILGTDGNIVQSVIDAIGTGLPDLLENGGVMVNQLIDGIFGALPNLVDSALDLCVSFIEMIVSNLPNILSTGKDILLNIVDGIRETFPDILLSAGDAVAELLSGLVAELPNILAAGFDLIVSLIEGIGNAYPDIIAAAGEVAKKLWDTIKNTDWLQVGKDIINGLIKGIGAMGNALWTAAQNIARSALNAIKKFLGIASPSKVMRDQVGKWIPSGVAVGIEANTKPLTEALHDMSVLTTDSLQADMNLNNAISGIAAVPVAAHSNQATISNFDVLEKLCCIAEDIEEANGEIAEKTITEIRNVVSAVANISFNDSKLYDAVIRERNRRYMMTGSTGDW